MNQRIFWPFLMLVTATLACSLLPSAATEQAATPGVDTIATLVALQLTAAVQSATPAPTAGQTAVATELPAIASGMRVVYAKSGNIRLWERGAPKQLTNSGQDSEPKISDDGTVVIFRRSGELWAVNADGTNERVLAASDALAALPHTYAGKMQVRRFDFSPKTHTVYFNTLVAGDTFPAPLYDLEMVDADAPVVKLFLNDGQGGDEFTFSPDGSKIALAQNEKINTAHADGSNLKTVFTFPPVSLYSEQNYIPQIVWMPDSSGFKTVIPAQDGMNRPSDPTRFYYIPADGGPPAQLAEFVAWPAFEDRPYISPDGAKVLYVRPQGANLELHVIDAGTADRMYFFYATGNFGILGWAPDSTHVIYWIDDKRRAWMSAPDDPAIPLSDVTFAGQVTWVDENHYLFMNESELRMRTPGQPSILIDSEVEDSFDFSP